MNSTRERKDIRNDYDSKSRTGYSYPRENRNPRENDRRSRTNVASRPSFYDYDAVQSNPNYRDGYQGNYSARGYDDNYRGDYRREGNGNYGYSAVAPRTYASPRENYVDALRMSDNNYDIAQNNIADEEKNAKNKKVKLAGKVKALIIVYITLVILISTMLLINAIPSANAQTGESNATAEVIIDQEALYKSADGSFEMVPDTKNEKYNTTTNWFDTLCDWMENIAK